jgi:hypothetical protein
MRLHPAEYLQQWESAMEAVTYAWGEAIKGRSAPLDASDTGLGWLVFLAGAGYLLAGWPGVGFAAVIWTLLRRLDTVMAEAQRENWAWIEFEQAYRRHQEGLADD